MDLRPAIAAPSLKQSGGISVPEKRGADPKIAQKAKEFEAVLLSQFIAAMEPKDGLFGKGFGGEFFQSLFRDEIAKQLSKQLDFGLAAKLTKEQVQAGAKGKASATESGGGRLDGEDF